MSYDLMVFNPKTAPNTKLEFIDWYNQQTEWEEKHNYDDPKNTSKELREWFIEMTNSFPAMNGPFASDEDDDDPKVTDYSIGNDVIYASFAWSEAENAYPKMLELAEKHHVGFFDSSGNGDILIPNEQGTMTNISKTSALNKPWWKFWN